MVNIFFDDEVFYSLKSSLKIDSKSVKSAVNCEGIVFKTTISCKIPEVFTSKEWKIKHASSDA